MADIIITLIAGIFPGILLFLGSGIAQTEMTEPATANPVDLYDDDGEGLILDAIKCAPGSYTAY